MIERLDVLTVRGQVSVRQEAEMLRAVEAEFGGDIKCVLTPKDRPARVDGVLFRGGAVVGIFECKCRDTSRQQMRVWGDEWLVTFEKLQDGAHAARLLGVPFFGFLYLLRDRAGLVLRIADQNGCFLPDIRLGRTETQATINGGKIVRTNAYVSLSRAREIAIRTTEPAP